jgi:hypothetical protein
MIERKPVEWFSNEPGPNNFFFRSPFLSWKFLINTVLLVAVCLAYIIICWKHLDKMSRNYYPSALASLPLVLMTVVYPYWWAIIRHRKINKLYRNGEIAEQPADSTINALLEVADNAMNDGLRNTFFIFGVVLFFDVLFRL